MQPTERQSGALRPSRLIAGGVAIAVIAGSTGAAVAGVMAQRTATSDAIEAVRGAGIMPDIAGQFQPDKAVLRRGLATALHRGLPRIAVDTTFSSVPAGSSSLDIAQVPLKVGGGPGKTQGVLVTVQMSLDHDANLAADCISSYGVTNGVGTLETWDVEFYDIGFGEEESVAFSVLTTQATNTTVTYHLLATNPCSAELFTDEDVMTAQTVAFSADGTAFPTPPRPAHRTGEARER